MARNRRFLALILLGTSLAAGAIIRVPENHATVQAALDAAAPKDTVVVAPGTYAEVLVFPPRDVTLTSEDPADPNVVAATVLTLPKKPGGGRSGNNRLEASVVLFNRGQTRATRLTGFTIRGGYGTHVPEIGNPRPVYVGGGVFCIGSSPTIAGNVFTDNVGPEDPEGAAEGWGGAVGVIESEALIVNNVMTANRSFIAGAMILIGNATAANNLIVDNQAWAIGGVYLIGGRLVNNTLVGNRATWTVGHLLAILPDPGAPDTPAIPVRIENNVFQGSVAGGGLLLAGIEPGPAFTHNLVHGNRPFDVLDPTVLDTGIAAADTRPWLDGQGNLAADPCFVDPAKSDFRLRDDSPCINAGTPDFPVPEVTTDLAGRPRVFAGRVDLGAYESGLLLSPVANAGPDQEVTVGTQVTLDGTASLFPEAPQGTPRLYLWDQVAGPAVVLSDPLSATPGFIPEVPGTYRFELSVFDGKRASPPDEVVITAVPAPPGRAGRTG